MGGGDGRGEGFGGKGAGRGGWGGEGGALTTHTANDEKRKATLSHAKYGTQKLLPSRVQSSPL